MSEENATPQGTQNESQANVQSDTQQSEQNGDAQQSDLIQLTPAQLKQRLDRAQNSVLNGLLEGLGVESVDTLKATLDAERKRKQAEMTETEKLQAELDAMRQASAEKDAEMARIQQQSKEEKRDSGLLQLLNKAHDATAVLTIMKAQNDLSALMDADGNFNKADAEKMVSDFQTANAYLFQSGAPGSPSNHGGRVPKPSDKGAERARNNMLKNMRRNA